MAQNNNIIIIVHGSCPANARPGRATSRRGARTTRRASRWPSRRRPGSTGAPSSRPRRRTPAKGAMVRVARRPISPQWRSIRCRPLICTYAPWGCIVRVDELAKSRKTPPPKKIIFIYRSFRWSRVRAQHADQGRPAPHVRHRGKRAVALSGGHFLGFVRRSGTTRAEGPHVGPQHVRRAKQVELTAAQGSWYLSFVSRYELSVWARTNGTRREPFNSTPMAVNSVSSGSPHVRPVGRTCGEPDEIKKNTHPKILPLCFASRRRLRHDGLLRLPRV